MLVANQDLSLFIPDFRYLLSFLDRPGGLLEYSGSFLTQFYRFRLAGALVLGMVIVAGYFVTQNLLNRISGKRAPFMTGVVTSALLMGMHDFYPHHLSQSLGFILAMALAARLPPEKYRRRWFLVVTVPFLYWAGGGFVWIFCGLILLGSLVGKGKADPLSVPLTLLYPAILILLAGWLIYMEPLKELLVIQLPVGKEYGRSPWPYVFVGWLFLVILLSTLSPDPGKLHRLWKAGIEIAFGLAVLWVVLYFSYNRKNAEFFAIEKRAILEDWDGVLSYAQDHPSTNLFGCFYTNLALANRDLLCEALFQYPQGFGRRGLCFGWEAREEILRRGSDFFWTIHFVNEAHHWAYESMIIEGYTRRNLLRLIQTELVRGNYRVAEKYISYLGSALFQRKLARRYARFLDRPEAIASDPELGPRVRNHMTNDFFAEGADLEQNLRSLLSNNPSSRPALDYLMALYLLEKQVEKIEPFLSVYQHILDGPLPTLLDECLLVYQITHREEADRELRVSPATLQRFDDYTNILRQYRNPEEAARMLYPSYKYTFWFHLNFNSTFSP